MGARIWAGVLVATGAVAFPSGALMMVQLARWWPSVESPGGLALVVALAWGAMVLTVLVATSEQ